MSTAYCGIPITGTTGMTGATTTITVAGRTSFQNSTAWGATSLTASTATSLVQATVTGTSAGITLITAPDHNRYFISNDYLDTVLGGPVRRRFRAPLQPGEDYVLPDGARLAIDEKGNYTINDLAAKLVYRANNMREFNRYINASDLLAEFIGDLRKRGWKQANVLSAPAELFINWLVFKAAEQDGEPAPASVPKIETAKPPPAPRCNDCGRYIAIEHERAGFRFCNVFHASRFLERQKGNHVETPRLEKRQVRRQAGKTLIEAQV